MAGENAALKLAQTGAPVEGVQPAHPCTGVNRVVDADAGVIELLEPGGAAPRRKFACVGFASSTKDLAPFADPSWAIIGMNQLNRHIPRADAWFEIHRDWNTALVPGTDHAGWLAACGIPVLMTDRVPSIPTSVRYPVEELSKDTGDYFTSTVAYMIAYFTRHIDRLVEARLRETPPNGLATAWDVAQLSRTIYAEHVLGLFGIDLVVGEEYSWQKPCAEFHLGLALARGITVLIPPQSALLKQRYRYGYEMEPQDLIKDSDLAKRETYLRGEHQKASEQAVMLAGALQEIAQFREFRVLRERGATIG
jgi:hypothetical protein